MQKVARNTRSCQKVVEQLVESPRPYFPALTCAVTSKTNINSKKVRHCSNKKYWPFKYLVTDAKGGGGGEEEGRRGGRGGWKREREKGRELTRPNSSPFFPFSSIRYVSLVTRKIVIIRQFLMTDKCHQWITLCTVFIVQIVSVTFVFLICTKSLNRTCCSIMRTD